MMGGDETLLLCVQTVGCRVIRPNEMFDDSVRRQLPACCLSN